LEDATEQGPVHGPRLNGFGAVGAVAVDALLADVELPASEIGRCGFHGVGVYHLGGVNEMVLYGTVRDFRRVGKVIG